MKKLIFLFCLFFSFLASSQQIENINFFLDGKNIAITYDFINCNSSDVYDISVVFVEQNQSRVTPVTLSGDIKKVSCGSKRIVWNLLNDREELSGKYQVWLDFKVASKSPVDIEWIQIPAGTFTMGSPLSEVNHESDETQHQVTLSSFKMSKNEITFAQYDVFCEKTGREKPSDNGYGRGTRPLINVSWDDATAFANWMGCRLPTEAEWEYACRSGKTTPFNTGDNLTTNQANYNGNYPYNNNPKGNDLQKTMTVGSYPSNSWGLNDMHGNVWEWCSDWYGNYPSSAQTNPTGATSGSGRVSRGGSWNGYARNCRSANRFNCVPSYRGLSLGFRLVVAS
jgi:sulfatase modifying factor 1